MAFGGGSDDEGERPPSATDETAFWTPRGPRARFWNGPESGPGRGNRESGGGDDKRSSAPVRDSMRTSPWGGLSDDGIDGPEFVPSRFRDAASPPSPQRGDVLRPLREVGFWAPLHPDTGTVFDSTRERPDPTAMVDSSGMWEMLEGTPSMDDVLAFVRGGMVESFELAAAPCRFRGCRAPAAVRGCATLTDGVIVWPEGLAHYIEDHHVRPPPELLARVAVAHRPIENKNHLTLQVDDAGRRRSVVRLPLETQRHLLKVSSLRPQDAVEEADHEAEQHVMGPVAAPDGDVDTEVPACRDAESLARPRAVLALVVVAFLVVGIFHKR